VIRVLLVDRWVFEVIRSNRSGLRGDDRRIKYIPEVGLGC
jgi:hypothetical protein